MKKIAIFASGTGSNARKIVEHLEGSNNIEVSLIVSNKAKAGVLDLAKAHQIPYLVLNRQDFYHTENILKEFTINQIGFIVLAGFLWLIPNYLVKAYSGRIVNIHPALLPAYGGKGMYGMNVHRAVWEAREKESGMTIHFVNEQYDEGQIIFQAKCAISSKDSPEDIAKKVLQLEHRHYPEVIEKTITMKD